jgi:hypothetical protein
VPRNSINHKETTLMMDRKRLLMAGAAAFVLALGAPQAYAQDVDAGTGYEAETQVSPQVPGADNQTTGEMGAGAELGELYAPQAGAEAGLDADTQVAPQVPSAEAESGEMGAGAEAGADLQ